MAMFIVNAWIIKLNCQQNCSVSTCSVVNCRMYLCKSACGQYSIQLDIYFHKKSGYYSTVCGGDTATQKGSLSPGLVMVIKCVLLLNQLLTRPVIAILPLEILILYWHSVYCRYPGVPERGQVVSGASRRRQPDLALHRQQRAEPGGRRHVETWQHHQELPPHPTFNFITAHLMRFIPFRGFLAPRRS